MFEAAELGRSISKARFAEQEPDLHMGLLAAQRSLADADFPTIVIVSGVEGAGKGRVVNRFHKWLDTRALETSVFWEESDEERQRPRYWRFWRALPPNGSIGLMFGSWYTQPIIGRVSGDIGRHEFDRELNRITRFEQLLTDDGALIVKFWFHLAKDLQRRRLKADKQETRYRASPIAKKFAASYDRFAAASERAIRITDAGRAPWHIVEASDERYRDLTAGKLLLDALEQHLANRPERGTGNGVTIARPPATAKTSILDSVDLSKALSDEKYKQRLQRYQDGLNSIAWDCWNRRINAVAVFEGWDAAGKGGAIRRVTQALDARLYRATTIGAPSDEELAHHYLWRFWRHLPGAGYMTIYDRSWYGRVLVERVEGFASSDQWQRAYQEINDFEEQLCDHGTVVMKFWIHIDKDEQLRRFQERQQTPWKHHKITDEDWRNRERWDDYTAAVNEMVVRTSTEYAPWTLVSGNDKKYARIKILKTFCERLRQALKR